MKWAEPKANFSLARVSQRRGFCPQTISKPSARPLRGFRLILLDGTLRTALFFPFLSPFSPAGSRFMAPAIGSRQLTVLREFRPHGLAVEEADGEGAPGARPQQQDQDYDYFLFDPAVAASPIPDSAEDYSASRSDGDHELFIRGNRCASAPSSLWTVHCGEM
jgi:hypothetical protein